MFNYEGYKYVLEKLLSDCYTSDSCAEIVTGWLYFFTSHFLYLLYFMSKCIFNCLLFE